MRVYGESYIGEKFVSHVWDGEHFAKEALRAKDGRRIEVIYHGRWNDDFGADFSNAEIKIDGQVCKGDVEVHLRSSHWRVHHHDVDPRYNSTILHVAMWDDGTRLLTKKQNGQFIPTLILSDYLDSSIGKLWKTIETGEGKPNPCLTNADKMTSDTIAKILDSAGMDRFFHRAKVFEEQSEEIGTVQLLYEKIMEAMGYSKNKEQFLELAQKVPVEILIGRSPEAIQAILFGVSGLLPSQTDRRRKLGKETQEYLDRLCAIWALFLPQFNGKLMFREQWNFSRIRPENYPTKRIAGISYVLSNCGNKNPTKSLLAMFLPAFSEANKASWRLRNILMPRASGYWTKHYTFSGKRHKEEPVLIGQSRSDDIVVNVILPAVFAYSSRAQDEKLQKAVITVYTQHRILQDNKLTRYVSDRIFRNSNERNAVVNSAMRQQGLIHLYKSFCDARNCQNCPLKHINDSC